MERKKRRRRRKRREGGGRPVFCIDTESWDKRQTWIYLQKAHTIHSFFSLSKGPAIFLE